MMVLLTVVAATANHVAFLPMAIFLIVAQNCALCVLGFLLSAGFPALRHWWVYLVWGPLLGLAIVWKYWQRQRGAEIIKTRALAMSLGAIHVAISAIFWRLLMI